MSKCIPLTQEDVDRISGPSAAGDHHALHPIRHRDGWFYVSTDVLDDPAHAEHHDFLASKTQVDWADVPTDVEPTATSPSPPSSPSSP